MHMQSNPDCGPEHGSIAKDASGAASHVVVAVVVAATRPVEQTTAESVARTLVPAGKLKYGTHTPEPFKSQSSLGWLHHVPPGYRWKQPLQSTYLLNQWQSCGTTNPMRTLHSGRTCPAACTCSSARGQPHQEHIPHTPAAGNAVQTLSPLLVSQ